MCSAELIAGAAGAAYLGEILNQADILTYSTESSLVEKFETATNGMCKAANGSDREKSERLWGKHDTVVLSV